MPASMAVRLKRGASTGRSVLSAASIVGLFGSAAFAAGQQLPQRSADTQARALIEAYYEELLTPACFYVRDVGSDTDVEVFTRSMFRPLCELPEFCEGTFPSQCVGGETLCRSVDRMCHLRATAADRRNLLQALESLRAASPRSDWIAGQSVSLALKNGELDFALRVAESCGGALWWCQALRGYTSHRINAVTGELQLDSALSNVPAGTAAWVEPRPEWTDPGLYCAWTDLSPLLAGSLLEEYQRLPCGQRDPFERRFWALSDPLWSTGENERRGEHLARNVQLRLDAEISPVSPDYHAAIVATGWPNSWRSVVRPLRLRESEQRMTEELRTRHELFSSGGQKFTPNEPVFRDPMSSTPSDWSLEWDEGEERMVLGRTWHDVEHQQIAMLRRGDSLLVLSAARLPVSGPSSDVRTSLALVRIDDFRTRIVPANLAETDVVRGSTMLADAEWLTSIEMLGPGWMGRVRFGLPAPALESGFGISDPVLVDERFEADQLRLDQAILPSTDLSGRRQLGLYFEVYGVQRDETLRVSLTAERTDRSFLSRIAGVLRLSSSGAVAVSWVEPSPSSGVFSRYLGVDLNEFDAGRYRIRLEVERPTGESATSSREVVKR